MSKKIVKRSLVLGALMAFVITGSAMAAELEQGTLKTATVTTKGENCGKSYTLETNEVTLTVNTSIPCLGDMHANKTTEVNLSNNQTLKLVSNSVSPSGNSGGLIQDTNIYGNGKVVLEQASTTLDDAPAAIGTGDGNFNNVTINADSIEITSTGYGIYAANQSDNITLNARTINIDADGVDIYSVGTTSVNILASENITIGSQNDNAEIGDAVYANGGNISIGSVAADKPVDIIIRGNVYTMYGSSIDLSLETPGSSLTGAFGDTHPEHQNNGGKGYADGQGVTSNLTLSEGATWTVTGASEVTTLDGDGGNIVFDESLLEEGNLSSNFSIRDNKSENLYVTSNTNLEEEADPAATAKKQLTMMSEAFGNQDNGATFAFEETDVLGAFVLNEDGSVTENTNTQNQAIGEATVGAKLHNRAHMNDMNKRMGELRNANGEHGVWVRMVRGEQEYEGTKAQYNQYQLGYDEKLSVDKRWTVGAAVTFAEGDSNFKNGSTEDDSTAFAIYGSKLNNDGTFVDLIARYARLESDVTVNAVQGDYSTNGYSVSAEFGKRFTKENGTWIEPQFELTYGTVDSAEYMLDKKKVQVGEMDSLIARAGFAIGKNIKQGNVYARASYLYDFDGETDTAFTSAAGTTRVIPEDLGGGWWEVGVGANINLSKSTYIYADVEKTFGGEVDTNWQWNLGVRYSF